MKPSPSIMKWELLINDKRFGLEEYHDSKRGSRSDFLRDYDRLVFSSPFRRLQNKTQVFPLPGSIFVHNRLTHSVEVACVGRSLATEVTLRLREKYAGAEWLDKFNAAGEIVSAACLAHDLGNPPFGHSGEKAIATFFSEGAGRSLQGMLTKEQWLDLTRFEGNANTFRLLTHRFNGRRPGGFAMTYSMLASIVKYPYESSLASDNHPKFGFFTSEKSDFVKVANELGMISRNAGGVMYARHPFVYLVEAADDICYEVMDIEDAHKLGLLPTAQVIDLFLAYFNEERRSRMLGVMKNVTDPNEQVSYLRSAVIGRLVEVAAETFVANEPAILAGTFSGTLIDHIPERERSAYEGCNRLSWEKIYKASDVVDIDLAGTSIISFLMEKLVHAVRNPHLNYSQLLLSKVPQQYEVDHPSLYGKLQAVVDHVSGMTDVYALDLYRRLNGMNLKINN
ncbi:MAG: dNTP triphosphohydrolase [Firmicutes bacterium]|nr:dNTP triphosphohydrolase [Bacillota bacterium]MCM1401762.1 dNTP triphosphohydrolase [Bacteroides sp.]MCM1478010.1 dNTP triphosphohydrolase [Bacteroides sp.]